MVEQLKEEAESLWVLPNQHIFPPCGNVIKVKKQFLSKCSELSTAAHRLMATARSMTSTYSQHLLSVAASWKKVCSLNATPISASLLLQEAKIDI